ncbi:unnamed protein product, partial [marine sediment metagenome]
MIDTKIIIYPEILIYSLNFQKVIDYELGDDEGIYV